MEPGASAVEPAISFDRFRIVPSQRLLLEAGKPVRIGSRAFDLLLALLERPGERVGKVELLARVWPGTHVAEGNLKFQVAALRRAIRDGREGRRFVEVSPGQGYCFVAPVVVTTEVDHAASLSRTSGLRHNLPAPLTNLVGRDQVVANVVQQLATHRLVTVVGPGGIGKTSVALAAAERLIEAQEDGVWLIDLARIGDPAQVCGALAAAVGLDVNPGLAMPDLVAALRGRRMLLLLDTCSHLVDATATLVAALLRGAPHLRILATSREPLRTEGEHLCRLGPLDVPSALPSIGAKEALRFPAVRLFVEQVAAAGVEGFVLTDDDAPVVTEICRRLDGIPLAIELAAARVGVLGLRGLAAQLDDRLRPLSGGRRTALPRHRTMRAALDWSHDLLNPAEQAVFRRLAVFVGGFTLEAAAAVAADGDLPGDEVTELVLELAAKSLVVAEPDAPGAPRFRMLETTRAYAFGKLVRAEELASNALRHATYLLRFSDAPSCEMAEAADGHVAAESDLGNLRAALAWSFGPSGDPAIGVRLAAASLRLWLAFSLIGEAHTWLEKALQSLDRAGMRGSREEMVLRAGIGISLQMVRSGTSEAKASLGRALELAEQLDDSVCQMHALHTLWVHHLRTGDVRAALELSHRAGAVAGSIAADPDTPATAEWMLGIAQHFAGEHGSARLHLERVLRESPPGLRHRWIRRAGFDLHTTARYVLAQLLWVQGRPDHAAEALRSSIEEARRIGHPVTLCSALAFGACPLALLTADLDGAVQAATEVIQHAEEYALRDHLAFGRVVLEIATLRRAGATAGAEQARAALKRWRECEWHIMLGVEGFAAAAAQAGLNAEISALVDLSLEQAERNKSLWAYPELLRVKGVLLLAEGAANTDAARQHFERSIAQARAHGALAWELRSAISLRCLDMKNNGSSKSHELLLELCGQYESAAKTPDLQAARRLVSAKRRRPASLP